MVNQKPLQVLPNCTTGILREFPLLCPLWNQPLTNAHFSTPSFSNQYKLPGGIPPCPHDPCEKCTTRCKSPPFFSITCKLLLPHSLSFDGFAFLWGGVPPSVRRFPLLPPIATHNSPRLLTSLPPNFITSFSPRPRGGQPGNCTP